jgi:hypothetical protein
VLRDAVFFPLLGPPNGGPIFKKLPSFPRFPPQLQTLAGLFFLRGGLVILLAPMALGLAETGPGGAGWKLLTFLCCAFAAWFFFWLKTAPRACGVAPGVGMRDGQAN